MINTLENMFTELLLDAYSHSNKFVLNLALTEIGSLTGVAGLLGVVTRSGLLVSHRGFLSILFLLVPAPFVDLNN